MRHVASCPSSFGTLRFLLLSVGIRQHLENALHLRRLDDVMVETRFGCLASVFRLPPTGECGQAQIGLIWVRPQSSGHFKAVHAWHTDIQENDFGCMTLDQFDGFFTAVGNLGIMPQGAQEQCQTVGGVTISREEGASRSLSFKM